MRDVVQKSVGGPESKANRGSAWTGVQGRSGIGAPRMHNNTNTSTTKSHATIAKVCSYYDVNWQRRHACCGAAEETAASFRELDEPPTATHATWTSRRFQRTMFRAIWNRRATLKVYKTVHYFLRQRREMYYNSRLSSLFCRMTATDFGTIIDLREGRSFGSRPCPNSTGWSIVHLVLMFQNLWQQNRKWFRRFSAITRE